MPNSLDPHTLLIQDKVADQHSWSDVLESKHNRNGGVAYSSHSSSPTTTTTSTASPPSTTITPKSQKLRHRLFRMPQTNASSSLSAATANLLGKENNHSSLVIAAATKLTNLAKASSTNMPHLSRSYKDINHIDNIILMSTNTNSKNLLKSRNNFSIFKSTSNLNEPERINFNIEDDEIGDDKENALFWQNLKSIKNNFTNTITLGRKFKKNVLKLSIFSSFSLNKSNSGADSANLGDEQPKSDKNCKSEDKLCTSTVVSPESKRPSLPNTSTSTNTCAKPPVNLSSAKNKQLKKQKRLKELEKAANSINNTAQKTTPGGGGGSMETSLIYKTI